MNTRLTQSLAHKLLVVLLIFMVVAWSLHHRAGSKIDPEHAELINGSCYIPLEE